MRVRSTQWRTALRAGIALAAVAIALLLPSTALAAAPSATTAPASNVTATSASVGGTVSPNGAETSWHMEYATKDEFQSGTYPHATPDSRLGFNAGVVFIPFLVGDIVVSTQLNGLSPNTTYHIRIVASNSDGTAFGQDVTFKTLKG